MLGEGRTINVTGNACYIEYVENYYENGIAKKKNDDDPAARMTDELKGEKGLAILKNLQMHGVLDENFYPLELSNSESAVLAYQIAIALDIKEMWKVFSDLWNISPNALRAAYNRGMEQKKTMKFLDEITPLLNDSTSTRT
jgi:hypothetical protein